MPAIWAGALLVLSGLLVLMVPRLWRRRAGGPPALPTPEPEASQFCESGVDPDKDWPGIALIAMGVILLLAGLVELWNESSIPDPA